jgi:2,4-dienoyl-CoA reductase-like NADH-dependent reductase (Old Yellow Enzyme family)
VWKLSYATEAGLLPIQREKCGLTKSFATDHDAAIVGIDELLERLERGEFDLVAVGRSLIANPSWPALIRNGSLSELRPFNRSALSQLS